VLRFIRCIAAACAVAAFGQQIPFVSVTGPNAPKGASMLLEDTVRGGIWLGGVTETAQGLTYFDGSRFISPLKDPLPKAIVTGMAEDREGGIWLAADAGLYRAFRGRLQRMAHGDAYDGILQAGPDVFLSVITRPGANDADLLRIWKAQDGAWKIETIVSSMPHARIRADSAGSILYQCPGGYCEFRGTDVVNWHPGAALPVIKHDVPRFNRFRLRDSVVMRDRFGYVWLRSGYRNREIACQCSRAGAEGEPVINQDIVGPGFATLSETGDGSIVIPSYGTLAIGRPGHFRVYSALNGYPGSINVIVRKDGIWLSNGNGLFVMPLRQRMEFWTERDGLDGNTWNIVNSSAMTVALVGQTLRVLDRDRSRWEPLPLKQPITQISAGPNGMVIARTASAHRFLMNVAGRMMGNINERDQADPDGDLRSCSDVYKSGGPYDPISSKMDQMCVSFMTGGKRNVWYANGPESGFRLKEFPDELHTRVRQFTSGGEVGLSTVRFFGLDRRGWIWRGSPAGVYVASPDQARQGQWLYLNRLDGIAGTDANSGSFFSDADGSVWFGLDNSVDHLYPSPDLLYPREAPGIFISSYSLNGGEAQMAEMVPAIKHYDSVTAHIGSLQADRRNALRVRYRVLPEQSAWRESSSLDLALGPLPSGLHTIEVQGRIFTGPWSATVRRGITVLPPMWRTAPFLIPCVLGSMGIWAVWEWLRRRRIQEERAMMPDLRDWRIHAVLPETHELLGVTLDGRFEVGELLASGGFATVMTGFDRNERRICALKIFRSEVMNKASLLRGFEQEVAALQQICHPNIVSIYADGVTPTGAPYLAMEFVEGQSLREILKGGPLAAARAGRLLDQLANALDAIHARGIFHRDVKPENVLVREAWGNNGASGEQAVLIDFSIAIIKNANETLHGISRAAGTFDYMAPEQALGYARPASDIFSLAKVVIEMMTGQQVSRLLPNEALGLPVLIRTTLASVKPVLSEESVQMLASALEFDPSKRPGVAGEFARPIVRDLIEPTSLFGGDV
jgi:hypothetical protein